MVLRRTVPLLIILFLFLISFLYVACKKDDGTLSSAVPEPSTSSSGSTGSSSSPTFTQVYSIFQQAGCLASSCHTSTFPQMGSQPSAYSNLVGKASQQCSGRTLVVASNVNSSYLIDKITKSGSDLCSGSRMPQGNSSYFDSNVSQLNTIKDWITAGAQNN